MKKLIFLAVISLYASSQLMGGYKKIETCADIEPMGNPAKLISLELNSLRDFFANNGNKEVQLIYYANQVVAGMNYRLIFKLTVDGHSEYIGIVAFRSLQQQIAIAKFLQTPDINDIWALFKMSPVPEDGLSVLSCGNIFGVLNQALSAEDRNISLYKIWQRRFRLRHRRRGFRNFRRRFTDDRAQSYDRSSDETRSRNAEAEIPLRQEQNMQAAQNSQIKETANTASRNDANPQLTTQTPNVERIEDAIIQKEKNPASVAHEDHDDLSADDGEDGQLAAGNHGHANNKDNQYNNSSINNSHSALTSATPNVNNQNTMTMSAANSSNQNAIAAPTAAPAALLTSNDKKWNNLPLQTIMVGTGLNGQAK